MAVNKEQVKQLLGSGLTAETVASAVGCEPSYISQLLGEDAFAAEVSNLRAQALMANTARDTTIGSIEAKLLKRLETAVDEGLFFKPRDVLAAVVQVNRMQRRGASAPTTLHQQNNIVTLQLPAAAAPLFKISNAGEVVEVDGQTLVTMPARSLLTNLATRRGGGTNEDNKYERARRFIPGAQEQHSD